MPFFVFLAVPPTLLQNIPFSRAVLDRKDTLLRLTLAQDDRYRLFTPLDRMSPLLIQAVLLHEDRHFYAHPGVNPLAALRALRHFLTGGGHGGASTLTMQLARLKYGLHTRSIPGKLWQMLQALRIELHYSKHDILEAYLNLAPYGTNIEGIGAASEIYFSRSASDLSLPEALTLAAVPQSPARRTPGKDAGTDAALLAARKRLFADWVARHPADAADAALIALPMHYESKRAIPFIAPQFTTHLLQSYAGGTLHSTLNAGLQHQMEGLLRHYVSERMELHVANASALLIDTRTMDVLASIGSADYFDLRHQGMVDGTRMRRSPGSALKPFIYALAFGQGIIHPMSLMFDAPLNFATYEPENFDHRYEGPMSAHDALIKSRNIPALWLDGQLRHPDFYQFLVQAGIGNLKPKARYGLSLTLGGAEVTMRELASFYAMLANDGRFRLPQDVKEVPEPQPVSLLSPEAAFLALDILKDTPPPGGASLLDALPLPVYWKTGTSGGLRDAWSVGIFGPYALAVWVGDFHGSAYGHYVGLVSAAPLFFDLVRLVAARTHPTDQIQAKTSYLHIVRSLACSDTGDVNIPYCESRVPVWLIAGISPIKPTNIYRRLLVNHDTGKIACHFTAGLTDYRVVQFWPSTLAQLYRREGITKPPPPVWDESCKQAQNEPAAFTLPPRIVSPAENVRYHLHDTSDNRLPLKASFDGSTHHAFWFVDDIPAGQAGIEQTLYWPLKTGRHIVRVIDDNGNADSREITVE